MDCFVVKEYVMVVCLIFVFVVYDVKKDVMVVFVKSYEDKLVNFDFVCIGIIGGCIQDVCLDLKIIWLKSGLFGGDQQIGVMIVEWMLDGFFFFVDFLLLMLYDVDVKVFMWFVFVYDMFMVLNLFIV